MGGEQGPRLHSTAGQEATLALRRSRKARKTTKEPLALQESRDHFAHCVQVFGGIPATSMRLDIDERAIRRFINRERPVSNGLLEATAKALGLLIAEAASAEGRIAEILGC